MIWIGPSVLCFLCVILITMQTLRQVRLIKREAEAPFEGPACLELFGHVTHVGWIRQGAERIDLLTIEGEALQCDARARYRLTPLTWKEFVGECLRRRETKAARDRADDDLARATIEDLKHKHRALREAMAGASELLCAGDVSPTNPIEQIQQRITDAQRMLIEGLERDDEIPF